MNHSSGRRLGFPPGGTNWGSSAALGSLAIFALGCGHEPQPAEHTLPPAGQSRPSPELPAEVAASEPIELYLTPESCFENELAAGSTHTYRFALEAGEYLHLGVEQTGVDVEATVSGPPAGELLLKVDSPTGSKSVEHVFLVAEIPSDYSVRIHGLKGLGRYQTRVRTLRQTTAHDHLRARAARAFSEARRLEEVGETGERAAEHYQQAAVGWRELGDQAREAGALYRLGKLHARGGRRPRAIEALERARTLYHRTRDLRREALTLDLLGDVYGLRDALERARFSYQASLELWRKLDEPRGQASLLNNLGLVAKRQGRIRPALELYTQALGLWRRLGERRDRAATLSNLGVLYSMLGEHRRALDFHRQALSLVDPRRDSKQTAVTWTRLADALLGLNETDEALAHYRRALALRRERRDQRGEAVTLNGIGWAHKLRGHPREALESFRTALGIFRRFHDLKAQATVLNNLGSLYEVLGQSTRAEESFGEALELARATGHRGAQAVAHLGRARVARRQDRLADAQSAAEQALSVFESIRGMTDRGDLRSAYLASKQPHYDFLVDLLVERHRRDPQAGFGALAFEVSERARARVLLEVLSEVRTAVVRGVAADDLRHLTELREEISVRHLERLRLVRRGASEEAAESLDRELRTLFEELRQAAAQLRRDSPGWSALVEPRTLSLAQVREEVLDHETLLLEYFLGEERGFLWAVTKEESELHELPDRQSIERAALRTYSTIIESHLQTGAVSADLAAEGLSRILLAPVAHLLNRRRLLIVAPGALQYVPFAALPDPAGRIAPGSAPAQPLVVDHEIVSLPSVSVLAALRRQIAGRRPPAGRIAVLADPVFEPTDQRLRAGPRPFQPPHSVYPPPGGPSARWQDLSVSRLPYSREEAEAILRLARGSPGGGVPRSPPGDESMLAAFDFDVSRALVESGRLAGYRIIHFSTHGVLDTEHPELSALVLSLVDRDGGRVDGYLRAYEIFNLDLPVDLVVLSACRTALGKDIRGEGLVGLTRAFMYAGAARVAVSLWNVDDRATAELMERFYSYLLHDHLPPSRALQQAQVSMWREDRWQAPYYWAAFVLQGDWRAFDGPPQQSLRR